MDSFILDEDCLNDNKIIGGYSCAVFIFRVFEELNEITKTLLKEIINKVKPAHLVCVIEEIFELPIFEIGISTLNREVLG